jgi:cytoskeletal protein CcmA (bactofilin family)
VEGDVVGEELTIGGTVKGTIHASRVKLNSTAVVEADIFHRSLSIEENARFEGSSKREDNPVDVPRALLRPPGGPRRHPNKANCHPGQSEIQRAARP